MELGAQRICLEDYKTVTTRACAFLVPERKQPRETQQRHRQYNKRSTTLSTYTPFKAAETRDSRDNVDIMIQCLISCKRELARDTLQITEAI